MGLGQVIGSVGGGLAGGPAGAMIGGTIGGYLDGSGKKRQSGYGDIKGLLNQRLADLAKRRKRRRGMYDPMEEKLASDINQMLAGNDPARVTGAIARGFSDINPAYDQASSRLTRQYAKMGRAGGNMTINALGDLERGRTSQMLQTSSDVRNRAYQQALGMSTRGDQKDESLGYINALSGVEGNMAKEYEANRQQDLLGGAILTQGVSAGMDWWGSRGSGGSSGGSGAIPEYGQGDYNAIPDNNYNPYRGL